MRTDVVTRMIAHLEAGRPLTALSIGQTYGVQDWHKAIFAIRARGYHLTQETTSTVSKYTGAPISMTEYRLRGQENENDAPTF